MSSNIDFAHDLRAEDPLLSDSDCRVVLTARKTSLTLRNIHIESQNPVVTKTYLVGFHHNAESVYLKSNVF